MSAPAFAAAPAFALDATQSDTGMTGGTDALETLHNRSVDTATGYAKMVEKAEPEFRGTVERFRALHAAHAQTLARILVERGVDFSPNGTLMGTVHKAVVSVRAIFDEIDEDVMAQVRSGETWVLDAFDVAIAEEPALGGTLRTMRAELDTLLADTEHLGRD